jgi:predicted DsbA family dithiol-disulfide isomerase
MNLTIDVVSDVICPWCYVGKRRLERAVSRAGLADVRVRWHPFQLNPRMPKAGMSRREYRTAKFGSWERSCALDAQVASAGKADGIAFAFENIERTPNTLDAHRLIGLADTEGVQDAVVEAIFRAYFTEGRDICDLPTLATIAVDAGLPRDKVDEILRGDDGLAAIQAAEAQARVAGVQGVPFFTINGTRTLSGAVPSSEFEDAFRKVGLLRPVGGDDEASTVTVCKVGGNC